jgi:uncharacterized Zn-finger protein
MNLLSYAHPQLFKLFKHLIYVWHRCEMQFERFYHLNDRVVGSFPHLHHITSENFPKSGETSVLCGGNSMNVLPYAHPQLFKVFKNLIYIWQRYGMQFERFYSLNNNVVGSFPHLHHMTSENYPKSGETSVLCGGNSMNVLPYAHPQLFKLFKNLIYIWHRCGIQF